MVRQANLICRNKDKNSVGVANLFLLIKIDFDLCRDTNFTSC